MQPKIVKFSNGLDLILQPMASVQSVAVYVAVGAGPRYETRKTAGIAHFLEHMLFEGTKRWSTPREVSRYIEKVGGIGGAWTDKEYVTYYSKVQKKHLELGLDYLSEILFNSRLDEKAIEKEKRIIIDEFNKTKDNPESMIWEEWFEWVWGKNQSLGRSTFGDESTILSINKRKLQSYMNKFYRPSNMTVAIAGNFSIEVVKKLVAQYFDTVHKKSYKNFKSVKFTPKTDHIKIINADTQQTQLILGFVTGIPWDHRDRYILRVIGDVLSGGMSSRMFHRLVYEEGIAYSVGASSWIFKETSLFYIAGGFTKENLEKATRLILDELEKLKKEKIGYKELNEAKEKDKAGMIFSIESPDSIASWYASEQLLEKRIMPIEEISKKIDEVTTDDIQRAAKQYFTLKNLCLMIRGPLGKEYKEEIENVCKEVLS